MDRQTNNKQTDKETNGQTLTDTSNYITSLVELITDSNVTKAK